MRCGLHTVHIAHAQRRRDAKPKTIDIAMICTGFVHIDQVSDSKIRAKHRSNNAVALSVNVGIRHPQNAIFLLLSALSELTI